MDKGGIHTLGYNRTCVLLHYIATNVPCSGLIGSSAAFMAISGVSISAILLVLFCFSTVCVRMLFVTQ